MQIKSYPNSSKSQNIASDPLYQEEMLKLHAKLTAAEQAQLSGQKTFSVKESRERVEKLFTPSPDRDSK